MNGNLGNNCHSGCHGKGKNIMGHKPKNNCHYHSQSHGNGQAQVIHCHPSNGNGYGHGHNHQPVTDVPEPGSLGLIILGIVALVVLRRRVLKD